jgi:hypothetical protein
MRRVWKHLDSDATLALPARPRGGVTSTSQGRSYGIFQKAIQRGNVVAAVAAAKELPQLSLLDALELTMLIATEGFEPLTAGRPIRSRELQLAAAKKEAADKEAREEELDRRRKTTAPVPAMEAMTREELAPARPRQPKEMLEVGRTSSERAGHRGIERSAHRGEEHDCGDARADLEAAVGDVTVRHPIADEVEEQSEWQRAEPRTDERAAGSTGRNVKGDDQAASLASRLARPLSVAPRRKTAERVTV